jgi:hypothetical protein
MATLLFVGADGTETRIPVYKSLTTIGSDPESDVVIDGLSPLAAHIAWDGHAYTIASSDKKDLVVGGKVVRKQILVDGEEIVLGSARVRFVTTDAPSEPAGATTMAGAAELVAWRRLVAFSRRLGEASEFSTLLEHLMDEVIALTHADKGFLVLIDPAESADVNRDAGSKPRGETAERFINVGDGPDSPIAPQSQGAAGFVEITHFYRPAGLPREQQPWLASVWRKPTPC